MPISQNTTCLVAVLHFVLFIVGGEIAVYGFSIVAFFLYDCLLAMQRWLFDREALAAIVYWSHHISLCMCGELFIKVRKTHHNIMDLDAPFKESDNLIITEMCKSRCG